MSDINLALTSAGQALMAKIAQGEGTLPLGITRIVTSSQAHPDPLNSTALVAEEQEFSIIGRQTTGARSTIRAYLSNFGNASMGIPALAAGYPMAQIGFYALDPDDGEILYRISQFESPNYVPALSERAWEFEPSFNIVTGNASTVVIEISPAGTVAMQDVWNSVEYSGATVAAAGVKTHYATQSSVPGYTTSGTPSLFGGASITEIKIQGDPRDPASSSYTVALPRTVTAAVIDPVTGKNLNVLLAEASAAAGNIDGGPFLLPDPISGHNIDGFTHGNIQIDGASGTLNDPTMTLDQHKEYEEAHGNIVLDGNK